MHKKLGYDKKKVTIVTKKKENRGKGIWMLLYR